jgi:sugar-phosphatase
VSPVKCLVIEDSLNGVIAGKSAKMKVVAMPEKEEKQLNKFVIADSIVNKLTEIRF